MSEIEAKEYNALVELKHSVEHDFSEINTEINSIKEDLYLVQKRLSSIKDKPIHDIIATASGAIIALFCIFKIGEAFF